ncbi:MAG: hypothetical protein JXB17_07475 [Bacteroidales bacterium]|nr:hypothetical protein [Bacteroidales bacterium]
MKKISYLLFIPGLFSFFFSCHKEELPGVIKISAIVNNVTRYEGSDGSIDITVTGGDLPYNFFWSNGKTSEDIDSLIAGVYSLTVTDKNNTTKSDTFEITQPENPDTIPETVPLALTITGQDVSVFGGNNGAAFADVSGGIKPYIYNWSNGSTNKDIYNLVSGIYILTVTDAIESVIFDSIFISQPTENEIVIRYSVIGPTLTGEDDGSIDITVSGGYPPYSYLWSNGAVTEDLLNLPAGDYSITVTDSKNQTAEKTLILSDVVTDVDGNTYSKIKIGDQIWMKENLKVKHDPDGNPITSYAYNNNESYVAQYGRLYTWNVAMNNTVIEKSQGLCPCGWHIPSDEEFKILEMFLGMTRNEADMVNTWRGLEVGTSLKDGGNSGYDAQLSGRMNSSGQYSLLGIFEYMWTSTEFGDYAWRRCLDVNSNLLGRWNTFPKTYGFSVRCIKDE